MPTVAEGGCVCGAIRYRVTGTPSNTMVCHCRTCRRVAASPVVAWATFPSAQFEWLQGNPSAFRSSARVRRTFCSTCGTQLTYQHDDALHSVDVATCSLDDPDLFPPTHHSWLSDDLGWVHFGDGLPTFQRSRPTPAA